MNEKIKIYKNYFKLFNIKNLNRYDKYFLFTNLTKEKVDILEILPLSAKKEFLKEFDKSLKTLCQRDTEHYVDKLKKYNVLFRSFENIVIDKLAIKSYLEVEKNETIKSCLRTFKNNKKLKYDIYKTTTGRLVISSGPQVLLLPAKNRSIIKSKFKNGKILSVDFSSLEPRVCLKLSGKEVKSDIYAEISNMLTFNADRSVIKRATISLLYGASYKSLLNLNISEERAKELYNIIVEYFGFDRLLPAASYVNEVGLRKNFFGRPINNIGEEKKNVLLNNYVQSTAVDISMMYFSILVQKVNKNNCRPLFVLHDAIVFDVKNDYIEEFFKITNEGYSDHKLGYFPLKVEEFSKK